MKTRYLIPLLVLSVIMAFGFGFVLVPSTSSHISSVVHAATGSECFALCAPVTPPPTCINGGTMPTGLVPFGYVEAPSSGTKASMEISSRAGCDIAINLLDFELLVVDTPVGVTVYDVSGNSPCTATPVRVMYRGFLYGSQSDHIILGNGTAPIIWSNPGDSVCLSFDNSVAGSESILAYATFI